MAKKSPAQNVETVNPEHEKLIEVLKFTPRTYKITMWGYGGETVMGTVDRKIYDYFRARRLDLSDFAWDSDYAEENNIPEDMWPFPPGSWYECDGMGHASGVSRNAGTLQIDDENGDTVFQKSFDDFDYGEGEPEWCCHDESWIGSQPDGTVVFIGRSNEKGTFFEADLPLTAPFDITKLELGYDEIDGEEIVNRVTYDGEEIDNWGGSTDGKSSDFGMYIAGSNDKNAGKWEKYTNMDDIVYTMTEWFPKKIKPVRNGVYMIRTPGKNSWTHQAEWNGKYWHSTWDVTTELKIKEWQGIAYNPDEQDLRDELDKIVLTVPEVDNMNPWAKSDNEPDEAKTLTYWTIKPLDKKSIEEVEHFTKDGMEIVHRTGWRWGEWTVATNDGNPPEFDIVDGRIDVNNCYGNNIEEVELVETSDGCWDDMEWPDDIDASERSKIEEVMEEDGYYTALEENGWWSSDTEMYVSGPVEITNANGDLVKVINE